MLAVARNAQNLKLLAQTFEAEGFDVRTVSAPDELEVYPKPDEPLRVALLDVDEFGQEVWDLCERLSDAGVPVILMARMRDARVQRESIQRGATLVLEKPVRKANLHAIVRTYAREKPEPG